MSSVRFELVAVVVTLLLLFGARYGRSGPFLTSSERLLNGGLLPLAVGALTAVAIWWVWGSLNPPPLVSDEVSYRLQAQLFASGRWSAPSPPVPEFFEQEHVLLVPSFASKYPPGHAIMLAAGELLGIPALVPLLLSGLTGVLVFLLVRSASNGYVAFLTWLLWLSASGNLIYRASYFSEVTTSAFCAGALWSTLRWFRSGTRSWLVLLAAFVGLGAITRPLTMLAFALPLGALILWKLWRLHRLVDVGAPFITVLVILAIIPLWSSKVTGEWRRTPLGAYTESYMPWDVPGFGLVNATATREAPPDMRQKWSGFMERHRNHQVWHLPTIVRERVGALREELFGGWRLWLLPAAIVGMFALNSAGWVALTCGVSLFVAYLAYAHPPGWVVYYMEAFPIPAFLVALGLWKIAMLLAARVPPYTGAAPQPSMRAAAALLFLVPLFACFTLIDTVVARSWWERRAAHRREFERRIAEIPDASAVVFVRHAPSHAFHTGHVENYGDMDKARIWLAHDLGEENVMLRRVAPERSPYLYDEANASLRRIP